MSGASLIDPRPTRCYPGRGLRELAQEMGLLEANRVITYCGAGTMASLEILVLTLLGKEEVALYDRDWLPDQLWCRVGVV